MATSTSQHTATCRAHPAEPTQPDGVLDTVCACIVSSNSACLLPAQMALSLQSPFRLHHGSTSLFQAPTTSTRCTNTPRAQPVNAALKTVVGGVFISTAVVMLLRKRQQQFQAGTEPQQRQAAGSARGGGVQLDELLRAAATRSGFGFDWPSPGRDHKLLKTVRFFATCAAHRTWRLLPRSTTAILPTAVARHRAAAAQGGRQGAAALG